MKNEKIIKLFAKVSYAFHHPIKKIHSFFSKEEGKLSIFNKLKLRKAEKNSSDIRIWSDEKFNKILEKLGLKKKAKVVPKATSDESEELEGEPTIDFENINVEQAVVAYLEGAIIDEEKMSRINELLQKIEGNQEKEENLKSFIKNNIKNDKSKKADLLELMLENLTKVQNESNNNNDNFNEDEIDQNEIPELSEVIEENSKDNKTNANSQETLGSLVEKFQMLGYEIKFRRDKAIAYYQEHLEDSFIMKDLNTYKDLMSGVAERAEHFLGYYNKKIKKFYSF